MSFSPDSPAGAQYAQQTMVPDLIAAATMGLVISISGVALRILARRRVNSGLQSDDWWILGALLMDICMKATTFFLIYEGLGRHFIFIRDMEAMVKWGLANEILWICITTPTKISVLCLYNRLFQSRSLFRWSVFIGTIVVLYSIAYGIALGFQTVPFRAQWTQEPSWSCNINALIGSIAVLDVITDVMIISSPVPQILRLNLNKHRKKELIAVFGVGAIVIIFGIVRAIYTSITPSTDASYNNAKCEIWSLVQPSIGILAACLPCLRPLLPRRLGGPSVVSSRHGPATYSSRVGRKRTTVDYEMYSSGKDGWRTDEEAPRTTAEATQGRKGESPERGIRVERNVEITYETNWTALPSRSQKGSTQAF